MALGDQEVAFWEISLAVGLVVIIVVVALLGMLVHLVASIKAGAGQLLQGAQAVADNTGNIKAALTVADTLDEITDEAVRHAGLLGVKL